MSKNILFVNTAHFSHDDRTFYHQAVSLVGKDYNVTIVSSKEELKLTKSGINIDSFDDTTLSRKAGIKEIKKRICQYAPQIIICDSPISVIAASSAKQKNATIIYDVTEWFPSKKNLQNVGGIKRIIKFCVAAMLNFYAGLKTNKFIFGEYYKFVPFKLFFWKKSIEIPYFPDLKHIKCYPLKEISNEITILYSGGLNEDKGFNNVIDVVYKLALTHQNLKINLKTIASFLTESEKIYFEKLIFNLPQNIHIHLSGFLPFLEYCQTIGNADLFLDLRKIDTENTRCLPIKLFYYLACGRPVIYSDLKAIQKKTANSDFIHLVNPKDIQSICVIINNYIKNQDLYEKQSMEARKAAENEYNWKIIEKRFIDFVQ